MKRFSTNTPKYKSIFSPAGLFRAGLFCVLLILLSAIFSSVYSFRPAYAEEAEHSSVIKTTEIDESSVANDENDTEEKPLTAINYLDFEFASPTSVYADDEVIAVADGDRTVFFCGGKIYIKKIKVAGNLLRNGESIYYSKDNNLGRVKIGEFVHEIVTDASSSPIGANEFTFFDDKLLTLTNTGMNYYENFVKVSPPFEFEEDAATYLPLAKLCAASGVEYFFVNGNLYKKNERICIAVADYVAEIDGKPYYSNADGIFRFSNDETQTVLDIKKAFKDRADGNKIKICGLSELNGEILFVNATDKKLMVCDFDGENVRDYIFDVTIPTGCGVEFTEQPKTVMVKNGVTIHRGILDNGVFDYEKTSKLSDEEDFVLLGETEGYYVLFGRTGFYLTASANAAVINENPSITREKGYILHDCTSYLLPVADKNYASVPLIKGEEISVLAKYEMNGIAYCLIENEDRTKAFVPAGEIKSELIGKIPANEDKNETLSQANYTLYAIIIILLGAAVFTLAMFMIFSKKKIIKL